MLENQVGIFPVAIHGPEGVNVYGNSSELEMDLEFFEDDDDELKFVDARGAQLRVRVWALELGLLQVANQIDQSAVHIWEIKRGNKTGHAELLMNSQAVMRVVMAGEVWPLKWNAQAIVDKSLQLITPSSMSIATFNKLWMNARYPSHL